uniref:Uncharacterized protein n=1 Tax=Gracilaria ferox TaxID=1184158 RepID=A0A345U709_9FLOR|nr:hypothetical protein [Gracilaria ferox]AXI96245.1 hypothetical protein [Gracilaria ferox]
MFEIYLILATCFLLPICFLITRNIIYIYQQLQSLNDVEKTKDIINIENKHIVYIAKIYINRKKWLDCITLLESYMKKIKINEQTILIQYYNYIGLCYQSIKMYKIAKKYYLQAYNKAPCIKQTLKNLANMYKLSGDTKNASKIYNELTVLNKNEDI